MPIHFEIGAILQKRFQVIKQIGEGGYGKVYTVKDTTDQQFKALKAVEKTTAGIISCQNEYNAFNKLSTVAGTPRLIFSFQESNYVGFVTPLLLGDLCELKENAPEEKLSPKSIISTAYHGVRILEKINRLSFVHRDVKLQNIMLKRNYVQNPHPIVLIDFGIAQEHQERASDERDSIFRNSWIATPHMIAGEVATARDDAMMMLYGMIELAGEYVFYNDEDDDHSKMVARKKRFEKSYEEFVQEKWMVALIKSFMASCDTNTVNYRMLKDSLKQVIPGFEPGLYEFKTKKTATGKSYLI